MKIDYTSKFERQYRKLPNQIKIKTEKQEKLFRSNPFYPSLHTEKLTPRFKEIWSFRIDKNYRVVFKFLKQDNALFLNIGAHDYIYKIKF